MKYTLKKTVQNFFAHGSLLLIASLPAFYYLYSIERTATKTDMNEKESLIMILLLALSGIVYLHMLLPLHKLVQEGKLHEWYLEKAGPLIQFGLMIVYFIMSVVTIIDIFFYNPEITFNMLSRIMLAILISGILMLYLLFAGSSFKTTYVEVKPKENDYYDMEEGEKEIIYRPISIGTMIQYHLWFIIPMLFMILAVWYLKNY